MLSLHASWTQLLSLRGVGPAIADRIVAARTIAHFTDWTDVKARVKGINGNPLALIQRSGLAAVQPLPVARFDPIAELPGDLAAICLSFVDVPTLLGTAQLVSRAWRDAIDGGLPDVWRSVCVNSDQIISDDQMAEVAQKCRVSARSFSARVRSTHLRHLLSFSNLRVLHLSPINFSNLLPFSPVLYSFPLLEELSVKYAKGISFPPMQFLKTVQCESCEKVQGLHNLPALTKLGLSVVSLIAGDAFPASLRELYLYNIMTFDMEIVDRIAALPQLIHLATDWSFAFDEDLDSCYPQLFEKMSATQSPLQHINLDMYLVNHTASLHLSLFIWLGTMSSVSALVLESMKSTDHDLQHLAFLTNLQRLTLKSNTLITAHGLMHMSSLANLQSLTIDICRNVLDFSIVGQFSQLKELSITHHNRSLSCAEVQAISQLHQLETLQLACQLGIPSSFSHFCTMSSLRKLHQQCADPWFGLDVPVTALSALPNLCLLEVFVISRVDDVRKLVDILVQMPKLRRVAIKKNGFSREAEMRLRDALPRLEALE